VLNVELEILLSDVDGVYDSPPSESSDGRQPSLMSVYRADSGIEIGEKSSAGRGGMQAKIDAALDAVERGVGVLISPVF
jgi:delta-1-pyrroline-5-carboxylate synthetase